MVCALVADLLGLPQVGRDDDIFELGAHSLTAMKLATRLRDRTGRLLAAGKLFVARTPAAIASALAAEPITEDSRAQADDMEKAPPAGLASWAQERSWLVEAVDRPGDAYTVARPWRLSGPLDVAALSQAIERVVVRHATLRSRLRSDAGVLHVVEDPPLPGVLGLEDLSQEPGRLPAALADATARPFDLARQWPFRATLFRLGTDDHALLLVSHHVATDGRSERILAEEIAHAYAAAVRGESWSPPPLPIGHAAYAAQRQSGLERSGVLRAALDDWASHLAGASTRLALPIEPGQERTRPAPLGQVAIGLPPEETERLRGVATAQGASLFALVLAAWAQSLQRITRQDDVVLGVVAEDRPTENAEQLVGYLVNTLPLRLDLSGEPDASLLLARTHERLQWGLARAEAPLQRILQAAPLSWMGEGLEAIVAWQTDPPPQLVLEGLQAEPIPALRQNAQAALLLALGPLPDGSLDGLLEFDASLIQQDTARRWTSLFIETLRAMAAALAAQDRRPARRLSALPPAERSRLAALGAARSPTVSRGGVLVAFERWAAETPDATAVVGQEGRWTYRRLNDAAEHLAERLLAMGVGLEHRIGVRLARSNRLVAAMIAVLKARAVYVPLDPALPALRLAAIGRAADLALVIDDQEEPLVGGLPVMRLTPGWFDEAASRRQPRPPFLHGGDRLACILHTSGSTGEPKGVCIRHETLDRLFAAAEPWLAPSPHDVWAHVHAVGFDVSLFETWGALAHGGRLVMIDDETRRSPSALIDLIGQEGVTTLCQTPSAFWGLLAATSRRPGAFASLDRIVLAGEALDVRRLAPLFARPWAPDVLNMYGPTETMHATSRRIGRGDVGHGPSVIGRPFTDTSLFVLDEALEPSPAGCVGEIWIAGPALARGYLGRPGETARRFVPCPIGPAGARMYRTGDLGRWGTDGELEFHGRIDGQLKIRGQRVEPGEVEAVLRATPGVEDVVVTPWDHAGETRLAAYVVAPGMASDDVRSALSGRLPEPLIPSTFTFLQALPLNANGKIDRSALPPAVPGASAGYRPPRTAEERLVCEVLAELVGAPRVGVDDDFLALGGHSLLAVRLVSALFEQTGRELPARAPFDANTPAALAQALLATPVRRIERLEHPCGPEEPVLSWFQEGIWSEFEIEGLSAAYNLAWRWRIHGDLDEAALGDAIRLIVDRHEPLRTAARPRAGVLRARLLTTPPLDRMWWVEDLGHLPASERDEAATAGLQALLARPFDLGGEVLVRAALWRLGPREHVLGLVVHHGAADGASQVVLARDLGAAYAALKAGKPADWPAITETYSQIQVRRQASIEQSGVVSRQLDFWRRRLAGAPARLRLPVDRPHAADRLRAAGKVTFDIDPAVFARVQDGAHQAGASVFAAFVGAWAWTLGRLTGSEDVVFGTAVSIREKLEADHLIGPFINTAPVRIDLSGGIASRELLARARDAVMDALENADAPFERVVGTMHAEREPGWRTGVQALLAWQTFAPPVLDLHGLDVQPLPTPICEPINDIALILAPRPDGGIDGELVFDAGLFDGSTIERWAGQFLEQLKALADLERLDHSILDASALPMSERALLLDAFNPAPGGQSCPQTLVDRFSLQTDRAPRAPALVAGDARLSYGELEAAAARLARRLIESGAGPERLVGVCLERGVDLIVALLAVLMTGGAYVPLDPINPQARLRRIVERTRPALILTSCALADRLPQETPRLSIDDPLVAADLASRSGAPIDPAERRGSLSPDNLAYVLFTSGSTGEPKGAAITHRAVVRLFDAFAHLDRFGPDDVWTLFHAYGFDFSVFEFWGALMHGGRLVVVDDATRRDPAALRELVARERVSVLCQTPAAFWMIADRLEPAALPALRTLVLGGEALDFDRITAWREAAGAFDLNIIDIYGPTETTVTAVACPVEGPATFEAGGVPIGRPLADMRVFVLDAGLEPVPIGAPGEIWIAGPGLSRGYFGASRPSAERFLPCPFGPAGSRMYRTGDVGRWLPDGRLVFEGRADRQVKLRGFRIELGEVEAALRAAPQVADAAVVLAGEGESAGLVAYVAVADGAGLLDVARLRQDAAARLPRYMIPGRIVPLASLPLNGSGKVDRAALEAMPDRASTRRSRAPTGSAETRLADIFARVLQIATPPVDESFFHLGGQSLLGLKLLWEIEEAFGVRLTLGDLLAHPTVERLALRLEGGASETGATSVIRLSSDVAGEPIFMIHWIEHDLARRLGQRRPVFGLAFGVAAAEPPPLPGTIEALAAHYVAETRLVRPRGPYRLLGHSLGGAIAFEMARQITEAGEEVTFLGLLDSHAPGMLERRRPLPLARQIVNIARAGPRAIAGAGKSRLVRLGAKARIVRSALAGRVGDGEIARALAVGLAAAYRPAPWNGRIDLFRAEEGDASWRWRPPPPPETGWRSLAGVLHVHRLRGGHMQIVKPPLVDETVEAIEAAMADSVTVVSGLAVHRPAETCGTHVDPVRLDEREAVGA